ncbi:hypothetical protein AAHH80_40055, partial [Burkholderia pseudomallei]
MRGVSRCVCAALVRERRAHRLCPPAAARRWPLRAASACGYANLPPTSPASAPPASWHNGCTRVRYA